MKKQILSLLLSTTFFLTSPLLAMDTEQQEDKPRSNAPVLLRNPRKTYSLSVAFLQQVLDYTTWYKDDTTPIGVSGQFKLVNTEIGDRDFIITPTSKLGAITPLEKDKLPVFFDQDAMITTEWDNFYEPVGSFIIKLYGDTRSTGQKDLSCQNYYNLFPNSREESIRYYTYRVSPILFKNPKDIYKITILGLQNILDKTKYEADTSGSLSKKGEFTLYELTPHEKKFSLFLLSPKARENRTLPQFFDRDATIRLVWNANINGGCFWTGFPGNTLSTGQKKLYGKDYLDHMKSFQNSSSEQNMEMYYYGIKPIN